MEEHKKQPKRRKKHGKYQGELDRMDYEGGNYGHPAPDREPGEAENIPVKGKTPGADDAPSKHRNDSPEKRDENGGRA